MGGGERGSVVIPSSDYIYIIFSLSFLGSAHELTRDDDCVLHVCFFLRKKISGARRHAIRGEGGRLTLMISDSSWLISAWKAKVSVSSAMVTGRWFVWKGMSCRVTGKSDGRSLLPPFFNFFFITFFCEAERKKRPMDGCGRRRKARDSSLFIYFWFPSPSFLHSLNIFSFSKKNLNDFPQALNRQNGQNVDSNPKENVQTRVEKLADSSTPFHYFLLSGSWYKYDYLVLVLRV